MLNFKYNPTKKKASKCIYLLYALTFTLSHCQVPGLLIVIANGFRTWAWVPLLIGLGPCMEYYIYPWLREIEMINQEYCNQLLS